MKSFFRRDEFKLCDVPVPLGYPQSQTHCSIAVNNDVCYLSTSPFPARMGKPTLYMRSIIRKLTFKFFCNDRRAESYENPCLYKARFRCNEPPVLFSPMTLTPLMDTPDPVYGYPSFNSDPELFLDDGKIYILNRSTYRTANGYVNRLYLIEGIDENNWFKLQSINLLKEEQRAFMSPCLIKHNSQYIMTYLDTNSYNDGKTYGGMYFTYLNDINQLSSIKTWTEVNLDLKEYLPWHMSLFLYEGRVYSIMACTKIGERKRCWQMLGEFSDDLKNMIIYTTPLTDYNSYRSSACVTDDGLFLLYNTTVGEKIKGGKSIDGREILMVSMDFKELLTALRNKE